MYESYNKQLCTKGGRRGCARERRASEHQGSKRSGAGVGLVLQQFHGIGPAAECQKRKRRSRVTHHRGNRAAGLGFRVFL